MKIRDALFVGIVMAPWMGACVLDLSPPPEHARTRAPAAAPSAVAPPATPTATATAIPTPTR